MWAAPGGRHPDGPAPTGRVLATAEVRPPVRPLLRSLQAQFFQSYEARRVQEPGGDTRTVLTVRVQLRAEGLEGSPALVEQQLDLVRLNAEEGVRDVLNQGQRLPNGDLLEVAVRFVDSPQEAHHVVEVQSHTSQEHAQHWGVNTEPRVIGHEVGHLLGLADEYRRQSAGPRPVYPEFGLMTAPGRDEFGRVWYDAQHPVQSDNTPPVSLRPHNLNELGSVLDRVFGTAPRPVPAGEFPMRAAFGEDARRISLFDGPDRLGGHLTPPPAADRRRLPRASGPEGPEAGPVNPNGTYRADAGEAALNRIRTMFPAHWTAEDAVYAAQQAYLDARRNDGITGHGSLSQHWVGEYAGVRIEGEIRAGEFTSFRPSDDQSGLTAAAFVPQPPSHPYGHRVEDLTRYGDRHTLTGFHHHSDRRPVDPAVHGVHIGTAVRNPNGTYRAPAYFLDPQVAPNSPLSEFPSRWHRPRGQETRTFYPDSWVSEDVLERVDRAYRARVFGEVLPDGGLHWIGTSHGVRIEGITRDGQHLVHRPTEWQPSHRGDGEGGPLPLWERPVVEGDVDYSIGYRRVLPDGEGRPDTELVVQVRDYDQDLTREDRQELQRIADTQAHELFPPEAQPGGRSLRVRLRFVTERTDSDAMPPVASHPTAFAQQLHSRLQDTRELVAELHRAPAPEPPLRAPVTPGTGHRPLTSTRLADLEAAGIDAPALHPALAAHEGQGLPPEWTAVEGRHAARRVAQRFLADLGEGATASVVGRFAGVELRVTLEGGQITHFEGTPGQAFADQRRSRAERHQPDLMALHGEPEQPQGPAAAPHQLPQDGGQFQVLAPGAEQGRPVLEAGGIWQWLDDGYGTPYEPVRPSDPWPAGEHTVDDNGVVRAHSWETVDGIDPQSPEKDFPWNWRRPADSPGSTVYYPRHWSADETWHRVQEAYQNRASETYLDADARLVRTIGADGGPQFVQLTGGDAWHWAGEAGGVRIEGVIHNGAIVLHSPTLVQPHVRYGQEARVPDDPFGVPMRVRRMSFDNGAEGVELSAEIRLARAEGVGEEAVAEAKLRLQALADEFVGQNLVHGDLPFRLRLCIRDRAGVRRRTRSGRRPGRGPGAAAPGPGAAGPRGRRAPGRPGRSGPRPAARRTAHPPGAPGRRLGPRRGGGPDRPVRRGPPGRRGPRTAADLDAGAAALRRRLGCGPRVRPSGRRGRPRRDAGPDGPPRHLRRCPAERADRGQPDRRLLGRARWRSATAGARVRRPLAAAGGPVRRRAVRTPAAGRRLARRRTHGGRQRRRAGARLGDGPRDRPGSAGGGVPAEPAPSGGLPGHRRVLPAVLDRRRHPGPRLGGLSQRLPLGAVRSVRAGRVDHRAGR